ncbi:hypothetical protein ASPZODRAFT_141887 [Penicilliopsis zonata CBS 506.65]|uniref:Uncharacterized protein n=1 Tax=Penicilliopsis zonata CBS 506.65 TaxID=1073090 RepID=A0A1L9SJ44_9EURO|nr:hypothetical protein ASPZODRAFT_141887 [Penicilliopsis zonata CBS 506.65]OJJ47131.1 hypothetical protein ASPZODRAFT_141887 [Penicilliopsis zonata CBS 506.65]
MANNPAGPKSRIAVPGASLRITPSNSPVSRPPARSPGKQSLHQSNLALQTVIGTTTTSPNGFSSHDESRSFAFCAGSAAVLAELDDDGQVTQRFFRARPSAPCINPVASFYNPSAPATPDTRARAASTLKPNGFGPSYNGSPSNDWSSESPSNSPRAFSSRERIKAVTSVSISPNGRFLGLGETGYNPRVLIFSTAKDSPSDVPLTILNEHTFGVRCLAFSPTSQYLATLGDLNDGFLFIWSVSLKTGAARLHSTNKCTAFIRDMCWMGQALITVGVRHVKVWRLPEVRPASPVKNRLNADLTAASPGAAPKALSGRNCLLGSLGDQVFTCAASISQSEAVIGTEAGALCYIDDLGGGQKLCLAKYMDFGITSLTVDLDDASVWIGGKGRRMVKMTFEQIREPVPSAPSPVPGLSERSLGEQKAKGPAISCIGFLSSHLVTIDSTREIRIYPVDKLDDESEDDQSETSMPAHKDPVLGITALNSPNELNADFFTWSSGGSINFWNTDGKCRKSERVELEQVPGSDDDVSNELKVVRTTEQMDFFVSGDRFGVLRVLSAYPWQCITEVRAHGGEITDIAIQTGLDTCLVASSGRDRMVQLFERSESGLELIQTMDDHVGAVGQLMFINDGEKLLSCSADRTVLIRDRVTREVDGETVVAYLISKVIRLKASPASMALAPNDTDILVISTVDRCIHKFDMVSGRPVHSFRASDPDSTDTVVMASLTVAPEIPGQSPPLLIGVSTTDKSVRVYDFDRDTLLTGEFGHTEGVSAVLLLDNQSSSSELPLKRILISAGMDGVVMIWNLSVQPHSVQDPTATSGQPDEDTPGKELTATKPPLRRILSRTELSSFQRQEGFTASPTPVRDQSPPIRRKLSKISLVPPSLKSTGAIPAIPTTPSLVNRRSPTTLTPFDRNGRPASPVSPRHTPSTRRQNGGHPNGHRSSFDLRSRNKNSGKSEFGSLNMSTEQVCRTLRAYRKKLNGCDDHLEAAQELERELGLTLRILAARSKKADDSAETETDSSGRESDRLSIPSITTPKSTHLPRRIPSTPNLSQKHPRRVSRSRSLDDEG